MISDTNYFELFGLAARFSIDLHNLEQAFRKLQAESHPDRYASQSQAQQSLALQQSTIINDGYQTLRNPVSRAQFLINLSGKAESAPPLSSTFLMAQMEWHEAVAAARASRDLSVLEALAKRLKHRLNQHVNDLASVLDEAGDFSTAELRVNELRFYEKLRFEIDDAIDWISS